jgi:hypothetical protein
MKVAKNIPVLEGLKKVSLYLWALLFAFLACFFFSSSTSPLYPYTNIDWINLDSNFFLYEANLWRQGGVPYVDFFDHKGLFHIALDYVGLAMGGRYGVFSLQILAGFIGLVFFFKSIALLAPTQKEWILFAGIAYFGVYSISPCGNSEGEWILPFVSAGFYFFVKGIKTARLSAFRLACFFAGLEVGLGLNSRPLDALWGGAMVVAYFVYYLRQKMGLELLYDALIAIFGCLIPFAIFLPIASAGGYLSLMFQNVFSEGLVYIKMPLDNVETWLNRLLILGVFALEFFLYRLQIKRGDRFIGEFFFVSASISSILYFVCARYTSYYWSGYTFYLLNLIYGLSLVKPVALPRWSLGKKTSLIFGSLLTVWACSFLTLYYTVGYGDFSAHNAQTIAEVITTTIPEATRMSPGKVFAIDCDAGVYTIGGITTGDKYFANQSWWARFTPEVKEDIKAYLTSAKRPEYLLVSETNIWTHDNFGATIDAHYAAIDGTKERSQGQFTIYHVL